MYKDKILELLKSIEGTEKVIDYLENSTFFTDPASAKYHSNFPGGLAEHSYKVYLILTMLCKIHKLQVSDRTMIITALLHDVVKIGSYKIDTRNHKNEKTNFKWESYQTYGYRESSDVFPHGLQSVQILSNLINLTEEEYCAIMYHMGTYAISDYDKQVYDRAIKKYPIVLLLHHADMQASMLKETVYPIDEIPFNSINR